MVIAFSMMLHASAASAAMINVEVTGIENDHGLIRLAVCTPERL